MDQPGALRKFLPRRIKIRGGHHSGVANVLFACLHNAGRSQMAAALFDRAAAGRHAASSAGTAPAERIHPEVIEAMAEVGIDLSARLPRRLQQADAEWADVVVTMGSGDECPYLPGKRYLDWDLPDTRGRPLPEVRATREEIAARVEQLAAELDAGSDPDLARFEALVADAIDRLPQQFQKVIAEVAVVVSDLGAESGAYGHYFGDGVARQRYEDRIVIYRDTLERDFGHDPELLAAQVERTLRHELAHHLGWNERGVGGLGL
jgi:arsenate reductase (thioredoxin)